MIRYLLSVFGLVIGLPLLFGNEWELVYPDQYPFKEDFEPLSVGTISTSPPLHRYLLGCRDGYVIAGFPTSNRSGNDSYSRDPLPLSWEVIKLPIEFDISAVATFMGDEWWVFGGPQGQVVYREPSYSIKIYEGYFYPESGFSYSLASDWKTEWLSAEWKQIPIESNVTVTHLKSIDSQLLALAGGVLYIKEHPTNPWKHVERSATIHDVEVFNGYYYLLEEGDHWDLSLLRSANGTEWEELWKVDHGAYLSSADLVVYSETFDLNGLPRDDLARMYVTFRYRAGDENLFQGMVSTNNGKSWVDHSSYIYWRAMHGSQSDIDPWNPLSLDEDRLGFQPPARLKGKFAGNVGFSQISDNTTNLSVFQIERYAFNQWYIEFTSSSNPRIPRYSITQWGDLSFTFSDWADPNDLFVEINSAPNKLPHPKLVTLSNSMDHNEYALPEFEASLSEWTHWTKLGDTLYGIVKIVYSPSPPNFSSEYRLYSTNDYMHWKQVMIPESEYLYGLTTVGNKLVVRHGAGLTMLNNETSEFISLARKDRSQINDMAYLQTEDSLYVLAGYSSVKKLSYDGVLTDLVKIPYNQTYPYSNRYEKLTSPDGHRLITFGNIPEITVIEADGTAVSVDLVNYFSSDSVRIQGIEYINGWYYILGPTTLRTMDFKTFLSFDGPNTEASNHIAEFDGWLFAFTNGGLFRKPIERGYLDSIQHPQGWYFSDWLGWFQIIDEELGDIDHLLLGECWVKPVNELEYWIRTEALGWIYIRSDWSPWFWRMEDGHWYWLDQDNWPGRAWDDDDQEWEELDLRESAQSADEPLS